MLQYGEFFIYSVKMLKDSKQTTNKIFHHEIVVRYVKLNKVVSISQIKLEKSKKMSIFLTHFAVCNVF